MGSTCLVYYLLWLDWGGREISQIPRTLGAVAEVTSFTPFFILRPSFLGHIPPKLNVVSFSGLVDYGFHLALLAQLLDVSSHLSIVRQMPTF